MSAWEYDETSKRLSFQQVRLGILKRDILSIAIDEDDKYVYLGASSAGVLCVALSNHTIKESFTLKKYISKGICSLAIVRNAILAGSGDGVLSVMRREPGLVLLSLRRGVFGAGAVTSISGLRAYLIPMSRVWSIQNRVNQSIQRESIYTARFSDFVSGMSTSNNTAARRKPLAYTAACRMEICTSWNIAPIIR